MHASERLRAKRAHARVAAKPLSKAAKKKKIKRDKLYAEIRSRLEYHTICEGLPAPSWAHEFVPDKVCAARVPVSLLLLRVRVRRNHTTIYNVCAFSDPNG